MNNDFSMAEAYNIHIFHPCSIRITMNVCIQYTLYNDANGSSYQCHNETNSGKQCMKAEERKNRFKVEYVICWDVRSFLGSFFSQ